MSNSTTIILTKMPTRKHPKLIHIYNKLEGKTLCGAETCHKVVSSVKESNCIICVSRFNSYQDNQSYSRSCKFCGKQVTYKSPYFKEKCHITCYRKQQKIDRDFKRYEDEEKRKIEYAKKKRNS